VGGPKTKFRKSYMEARQVVSDLLSRQNTSCWMSEGDREGGPDPHPKQKRKRE
jgi:hypothetical protein